MAEEMLTAERKRLRAGIAHKLGGGPKPRPRKKRPMAEEMVVIARTPGEMQVAQQQLVTFAVAKMDSARTELEEVQQNLDIAVQNKWRTKGLKTAVTRARQRFEYYEKLHAAIEAGYAIVPNFDIDVFAIRTTRKKTKNEYRASMWNDIDGAIFPQETSRPASGCCLIVVSARAIRW